ncbi:MAG: M56 family metallopeptidase [Syntrophomonas sp.]
MQAVSTIFDWVVLSSITGTILVLLILGVKTGFKNTLGANWHYYIWFLLLLKLIIPFTPESPVSIYNLVKLDSFKAPEPALINSAENGQPQVATGDYDHGLMGRPVFADLNSQPVEKGFAVAPKGEIFLMVCWLVGAALLAFYTIFINLKLWYRLRSGHTVNDAAIIHIIESSKSAMKIKKHIPVIVTDSIRTPALFGLINPVLLMPRGFIYNLNKNELQYIVLHELAHYKRKDILVNWLTVVVQIIYWFNPIIWYGFYRMHLDGELACDAQVLSALEPPMYKEYGNAIIRVLEMTSSPKWIPGASQMLTPKSNIKRRIAMISSFRKESLGLSIITVIVFIAIGIIGCTAAPGTDVIESNKQDDRSSQLLTDLKTNQMLAGTVDVEGQGIVVTLTDSYAEAESQDNPNNSIVHDSDILMMINELMVAGAEAISINDERLINSSGIVCQGTNIMVNGKPCIEPFVIKAIGSSERMVNAMNKKGRYANCLEELGIGVKIEKSEKLTIPKYEGKVDFEYAKPVENKKS